MKQLADVSALPPIISCNEDIYLRPIKENDVEHIHELYKDAELFKYTDESTHTSKGDSVEFIRKEKERQLANRGICWSIKRRKDEKLIGVIRIKDIDHKNYSAVIGYYLHNKVHGKGLASLSLKQLRI